MYLCMLLDMYLYYRGYTYMIWIENSLERKKIVHFYMIGLKEGKQYMFLIMVSEGRFLYVIITCISRYMEKLRCKEFSDWLTQNVNNSWMSYQFVICDLSMQMAWHSLFPINTEISQCIYFCILLIAIFVCTNILLLFTVCLALLNTNISSNMKVTTVGIFGEINSDHVDLCFCLF